MHKTEILSFPRTPPHLMILLLCNGFLCLAHIFERNILNGCSLCHIDPATGLALCWPVFGEASGGNHCSCHSHFQHSSADAQLYQSQLRRQGTQRANHTCNSASETVRITFVSQQSKCSQAGEVLVTLSSLVRFEPFLCNFDSTKSINVVCVV